MVGYISDNEYEELLEKYRRGKLEPTPKEGLVINPKVAYYVSEQMIKDSIPEEYLSKNKDKYGTISRLSKIDPVKGTVWDYLYFVDSSVFRPAALQFEQSQKESRGSKLRPAYTRALNKTKQHSEYWKEEFNRIINGYEPIVDGKPCGLRISGEMYFYLNYGWMQKVEFDEFGDVVRDMSGLPDFLAMDYYYYKELEARENPKRFGFDPSFKQSLIVAKSRRKGFSYKAGCGAVWITAFRNKAKVLIASETGADAATCFAKAADIIDHISEYTPFGREDIGIPRNNGGWKHTEMTRSSDSGYFEFSLKNTRTGERKGRQSAIEVVSLYNKADAASGQGVARVYFEEAGKCSDLQRAWGFTLESLRVGSVYRGGIAIIFGTGGEMITKSGSKGSSKDFSILYNNPEANGLGGYENEYDYKYSNNKVGYFVSDMWSNFGAKVMIDGKLYKALDKMGNPLFWVAEAVLNMEREAKRPPNGKKSAYEQFLTQRCKTPTEAFLIAKGSRFQVEDLVARQTGIANSIAGFEGLRLPGELVEIEGKIEFIPDPTLQPITTTNVDLTDREGCLLRYEAPIRHRGQVLEDAYIISVDPIGINTEGGKSLVGIIVYKTSKYSHVMGEEKIVATYYGRKRINPQDYTYRLLLKLSKYYNAKITYENDRDGGIFAHFLKIGELGRLLHTPRLTMDKFIPGSKTTLRAFGHSCGSSKHKEIAENLIYEWLDRRGSKRIYYDTETGEKVESVPVRNVDMLEDQLLIEQLISYDRNGNYDAVSAFMGIMFQLNELYSDPYLDIQDSDYNVSDELNKFYNNLYQ